MHVAKNMPPDKTGAVQNRLVTNEVKACLGATLCSSGDFWTISGKFGQKCLDTGKILYYSLIASLAVPLLARY